ncbi:MAG: hypothetical protein PUC73_12560 [Lachnospiraceae bacterium]|nr:hypothetical protein [Lachnospiraceae bacterium]
MTKERYETLKKGDTLYFARIMPSFGYYEIHDVQVVTKYDDHCTVTEKKTKQSFLFNIDNALKQLYIKRNEALDFLKIEKEKNKNTKVYAAAKEEREENASE